MRAAQGLCQLSSGLVPNFVAGDLIITFVCLSHDPTGLYTAFLLFIFGFCVYMWIGSQYVALAGMEFRILLPQILKYYD